MPQSGSSGSDASLAVAAADQMAGDAAQGPFLGHSDSLEVRVGYWSDQGPRHENQDFGLVFLGDAATRASHGVIAALADGVSGAAGGRIAAELAVRGFIDGFLAQKETLPVHRGAAIALTAIAGWIAAEGRTDRNLAGMATTLTALILRGRRAYGIHLGDTRLYRFSQGRLTQLTSDHNPEVPGLKHVLTRALGPDDGARADFVEGPVAPFDRYLLTSDGVHGVLPHQRVVEVMAQREAPDETARRLVIEALAAGGRDNATAVILDVIAIPPADRADLAAAQAALPIASLPEPGQTVDNYLLGPILSDGQFSRLFRATDQGAGAAVIVKFPNPELAAEPRLRKAFLREAWISTRLRSPWLGETFDPDPKRQTRLYTVMVFHGGETLEQRLLKRPRIGLSEGLGIAERLAKAVALLHRAGIIHRDIKPSNVILERHGGVRLIDLGLARVPGVEEEEEASDAIVPGTPSYMAPELFSGARGDVRSDLYALGVTLYRMFTGGDYPYGEVRSFMAPRFSRPTSLTSRRPDLPAWLDAALVRAFAVSREARFEDAIELVLALEGGEAYRPWPRRVPLYQRNPLLVWKVISLILGFGLVAALAALALGR